MSDYKEQMNQRTMDFSLRVLRLFSALKGTDEGRIVAKQLFRSATSVGANYREACHSRSTQEFVSKLKICESEAAECAYWLELIAKSGMMPEAKINPLLNEAEQLTAIFTSSTHEIEK